VAVLFVFVVCGGFYILASYSREVSERSGPTAHPHLVNAFWTVCTLCAITLAVLLAVVHMIASV
jgi:hypothetical protein